MTGARKRWNSLGPLGVVRDEPLLVSVLRYRFRRDVAEYEEGDLVSSHTRSGVLLPIVDLDYPHQYVASTTKDHAHLYLGMNTEDGISRWRWVVLMIGLRIGKVIEPGFFWWSLRRGGNFVRVPGVKKHGIDIQQDQDHA